MNESKRAPLPFRLDVAAPYDTAEKFLTSEFCAGPHRTLHHHRGSFYAWNGAAYLEIGKDDLRARIYCFLDGCTTGSSQGKPVKPNATMVNSVFDALMARAQLSSSISAPAWLDES